MGNKNGSAAGGLDAGAGSVCGDAPLGLGPELLASLQSLGLDVDETLLPHSLHQIAQAYSLKEDYQWALNFLQLEKLYHERLLSNLAALQESWEGQWREKESRGSDVTCDAPDVISQKHMETLRHICRTHHRPYAGVEAKKATRGGFQSREEKRLDSQDKVNKPDSTEQAADEEDEGERAVARSASDLPPDAPRVGAGRDERQGAGEDETDGGEAAEEEPLEGDERVEEMEGEEDDDDEDEGKLEWPAGVAQASERDLAKLSHKEGTCGPDGLVSILKRRRASLDGLPPPSCSGSGSSSSGSSSDSACSNSAKESSRRKVRFTEPEDGAEQDVVCRESCLILLLMCLVTVVISVGGTALYCTLVDNDFAQQLDRYVTNAWGFLGGLGHLLPFRT